MANVEEHVVSMKFNNKDFEKNAQQSLGTLERLKKALHFEESSKSLKKLGDEANNLNLDKMSTQLDGLEKRFSTLGIIGASALNRITNAAIDLGKSVVNDVTKPFTAAIAQIKSGGLSRAMNLEHANFQLLGLTKNAEKVAEIMGPDGPVQAAVDGTAYGLDAAAVAASSLVASNVGIKELYTPLRAIAGVAAMTGREYSDIANIFTTVAGQGKIMTMQLRQLEASGVNAAAVLAESLGKTESEVREMVTQSKISFAQFTNAMSEAFGEHASKANDTYSGSLSNVRAALSRIGAKIATPGLEHLRDMFNQLRPAINEFNSALGSDDEPGTFIYHVNELSERFIGLLRVMLQNEKTINALRGFANLLGAAFERLDKLLDFGGPVMIGLQGIANIFKALISYIKPVAKAFMDVFPPATIESMRNAALHFKYFTENLKASEPVAENIRRAFRGIFSVFKVIGTVIKEIITLGLNMARSLAPVGRLLTEIFGTFGDVLSDLGYYITLIQVAIDYTFEYFNIFDAVGDIAHKVLSSVWGLITSIGNLVASTLGKVINTILNMFGVVGEPIKDVGDLIGFVMEAIVAGLGMVLSLFDAVADGIDKVTELFTGGADAVNEFNGEVDRSNFFINVLRIAIESIKTVINAVFTAIVNVMNYIQESGGLFNAIGRAWSTLGDAIGGFFESLQSSSGGDSGESIFTKIGDGLSYIGGKLKEFADGLNMGNIALAMFLGTMLAMAVAIVDLIGGISRVLHGIGKITHEAGELIEAVKWKLRPSGIQRFSTMIKAIAQAITALTAALVIIASTPNVDEAMIKLGILVGAFTALFAAIVLLSKHVLKAKQTRQMFVLATGFVAMSVSILVLTTALRRLNGVDTDGLLLRTGALVALTLSLAYAAKIMSKNEGAFIKGAGGLITFAGSLAAIVGVIALLSLMDAGDIWHGVAVITALTALVAGLMVVSRFSKKLGKVGLMFIALAVSLRIMARVVRLFGIMDTETLVKGKITVVAFIMMMRQMIILSRYADKANLKNLAKMFTSLGLAILAMSVGVRLIGKMDLADIAKGIGAVAALTALMLGLAFLSKMLGVTKPAKLAEPFKAMGIALIALSGAIFILGSMDIGVLTKGSIVVAGFLALLALLTRLTTSTKKAQPTKMAILFGAMAVCIGVLAAVVYIIGSMDTGVVVQGAIVVGGILALFALIIKLSENTKKIQPGKLAAMLVAVTAMVGVLALAIYEIGQLKIDQVLIGSIAIAALLLLLNHIAKGMSKLSTLANMKTIITSVASTLAFLGGVVGAILLLKDVPLEDMVKVTLTVSAMMLVLTLVAKSISKMQAFVNIGGIITSVLGAVGLLATLVVAIMLLSKIPAGDILVSMGAITAMLLVMVGITKLMNSMKVDLKSFEAMIAASAMLLSVGLSISLIAGFDWVGLLASVAAMSVCLVAVALVLKYLVANTNTNLAQVGLFLLGLGSLVIIAIAIKQIAEYNWGSLITAAISISLCLAAYVAAFEIFNLFHTDLATVGEFLLGVASLYLVALAMSKVLEASTDWTAITAAAAGLSACVLAVGAVLALFGIIPVKLTSILGFAAAVGGLYVVALALEKIIQAGDYLAIEAAADALLKAVAAMGLVLIEMAAAAALGVAVIAAAPVLAGALAAVTAIVIAMGAIYKIPFVEELVQSGGKLLALIGEAIGNFFGGIVKGFATIAAEALPAIGESLAGFANTSKPFWDMLKSFKGNGVLEAATTIAAVVLELTAASLLNTITDFFSWLTGGDGGFQELADNLVIFGRGMAQFSEDTKDIKPGNFLLITQAAKNLSEVLDVLEDQKSGGLFSIFSGETDWEGTLNGLSGFGTHMKTLSDEIKDVKPEALTKLKDCSEALKNLVDAMPENPGAISGLFSSYKDLGDSSEDMEKFAETMVTVSDKFTSNKIDKDAIENAVNAAKLIAALANELPEENGAIKGLFSSETMSLDTFVDDMDAFADGIVAFSDKVKGKVDEGAVKAAADAGQLLAALANNLPKTEDGGEFLWGLFSWGDEQDDLEDFGDTLVPFAEAMVNFSKTLGEMNYDAVSRFEPTVTALSEIVKNVAALGESNFQSFSNTFVNFGEGLKKFSDNTAEINSSKITQFSEVLQDLLDVFDEKFGKDFNTKYKGLTNFTKNINRINDSLKMITDDRQTEIGKFGETLEEFTKQYREFASEDKGVGAVDDSQIKKFADQLKILKNAMADQNGNKKKADTSSFKEFEKFANALKKTVKAITDLTSGAADVDKAKTTLNDLSISLNDFIIHMKDIKPSDIKSATRRANDISVMINDFVGKKMDTSGLASMSKELKSAINGMVKALDSMNTKVKTTYYIEVKNLGTSIVSKFAAAIKGKTSEGTISAACGVILNKLCNKLDVNGAGKKYAASIEQDGMHIIDGFIKGMKDYQIGWKGIYETGKQIYKKLDKGIRDAGGIESPSKETKKLGEYTTEGFLLGIDEATDSIYDSGYGMGENYMDGLQTRLGIHSPADALISAAKNVVAGWLGELNGSSGKVFESGSSFGGDFLAGLKERLAGVKKGEGLFGDDFFADLKKKFDSKKILDDSKKNDLSKQLGKMMKEAGESKEAKDGAAKGGKAAGGAAGKSAGDEAAKEYKKALSLAVISAVNTLGSEIDRGRLAKALDVTKERVTKILKAYKNSIREISDSFKFMDTSLKNQTAIYKFAKAYQKQTKYISNLAKKLNKDVEAGEDKITKSTIKMVGKMLASNTKEYKKAQKEYKKYTNAITKNAETVQKKLKKLTNLDAKYKKETDEKEKKRLKNQITRTENAISKLEASTKDLRVKAAKEMKKLADASRKSLKQLRSEIKETIKSWFDFQSIEGTSSLVRNGFEELEKETNYLSNAVDVLNDNLADNSDTLDNTTDAANNATKAYDALSASMDTGINLFERFNKTGSVESSALFENADSQLEAFEEFQNGIEELERRGLDIDLVDQLAAEGPEALNKIRGFLSMSSDELQKYNERIDKQHEYEERALERSLRRQYEQYQEWVSKVEQLKIKLGTDNINIVESFAKAGTGSLNTLSRFLGMDGESLDNAKKYFAEGLKDIQTFGFESLSNSTSTSSETGKTPSIFDNITSLLHGMVNNNLINEEMRTAYQAAINRGLDPELALQLYQQNNKDLLNEIASADSSMIESLNKEWEKSSDLLELPIEQKMLSMDDIYESYKKQVKGQDEDIAAVDKLKDLRQILMNAASSSDMSADAISKSYDILVADLKEAGKSEAEIYSILQKAMNDSDGNVQKIHDTLKEINERESNNTEITGKQIAEDWDNVSKTAEDKYNALKTVVDKMGPNMNKALFDTLREMDPEKIIAMSKMNESQLQAMADQFINADKLSNDMTDDLEYSVITALSNTANSEKVTQAYSFIGKTHTDSLKKATVASPELISDMSKNAGSSLVAVAEAIGSDEAVLTPYKKAGKTLGKTAANGVGEGLAANIDKATPALKKAGKKLVAAAESSGEGEGDSVGDIYSKAGKQLGANIINGFGNKVKSRESVDGSKAALNALSDKAVTNSKTTYYSNAKKLGLEMVIGIIAGFNSKVNDIKVAVENGARNLFTLARSVYYQQGYWLGQEIVSGLASGIYDSSNIIKDAVEYLARETIAAARSEKNFDINSPSKKFMVIGNSLTEGLAKGITNNTMAETAIGKVAHSTIEAMRDAIMNANNEIDSNLQLSPIITPKLDLSLVKNHAGSINRLFDARVEANAELVAANQNGGSNTTGGTTFIQNNYSPKALNREEIYRQTRNQFAMARKAVGTNDTVSYGY